MVIKKKKYLASIGKKINNIDHILYLLGGSGSEYNPFAVTLTTRLNINLEQVHSLFHTQENWLDQQNSIDDSNLIQVSATIYQNDNKKKRKTLATFLWPFSSIMWSRNSTT